ncbi:putative molybdenum carrier protein [Spirosoma flavus]
MPQHSIQRIISGGQTGIDQLGLEVARSLGISTGGVAPKGYLTENGSDERLRDYGLTEHTSTKYPPRTRANVVQSDGTVIFGNVAGGTKLTLDTCVQEGKPYLVNPTPEQLRTWLKEYQIRILNVAGSRGRNVTPEQLEQYRQILTKALRSSDM